MRGKTIRGAWLLAAWMALAPAGRGQEPGGSLPGTAPPPSPVDPTAAWRALPSADGGQPARVLPIGLDDGTHALPPSVVRAQQPQVEGIYAPAEPQLPVPLGSTRPEDGGLFATAEFMYYRWNNPLKDQLVAIRGFQVSDGVATPTQAAILLSFFTPPQNPGAILPGTFLGSGDPALNVNQLTGNDSYQAGFRVGLGWKFGDGSAVYGSYFRSTEESYRAGATLARPGGNHDVTLADTFLFSPVFNFPPQFAGADNKVFFPDQSVPLALALLTNVGPGPGAINNLLSPQFAFGAWNGASVMTLSQVQRFQEWELTYRQTICETEDYRLNGLVGPRYSWIWDHFRWTSTTFGDSGFGDLSDPTAFSATTPVDVAIYDNIVSNSMWGVHTGLQSECYLGHGFVLMAEVQTALFMDAVHEIAVYSLEDKFAGFAENKRSKKLWNVVPEIQGSLNINWYPWEFIEVRFGYEAMVFFNTIASRRPIDFDYSNLAPHYSTMTRCFDGFHVGLSLTF
jgi:hypothetical protein